MIRPRLQGEPTAPWCTGWARFLVEHEPRDGERLVVAARFLVEGLPTEHLALLDTGAQWSILGGELAEAAAIHAEDMGETIRMSTRLGQFDGRRHRVGVTLVAEEGEDMIVSATVLLVPEWPSSPILGYRGLLERIRLAFAPGLDGEDWLGFGSLASNEQQP